MGELMQTGKQLTNEIDRTTVPPGSCAVWWLGQHGFVVKLGETILYLDPYISPARRRNTPPLLCPEDLGHTDLVLGTHDHADHIDRPAWPAIAAVSEAFFVVPRLLLSGLARELGIPPKRFLGLDDDQTVEVAGLQVTGIAAAHEFIDRDPETGACPYLGYMIEGKGCRIYHAGDSCRYEGMQTKLQLFAPDVMFLPINGRDAERLARGCIGNMTYQEAADLAGAVKPRLVVPAHFDMFPGNTEDPELFRNYMAVKYPDIAVKTPRYGQLLRA